MFFALSGQVCPFPPPSAQPRMGSSFSRHSALLLELVHVETTGVRLGLRTPAVGKVCVASQEEEEYTHPGSGGPSRVGRGLLSSSNVTLLQGSMRIILMTRALAGGYEGVMISLLE